MSDNPDFKHIVRIMGKDLAGAKNVTLALNDIKGIGSSYAHAVIARASEEMGITGNEQVGLLNDKQLADVEDIITNPTKHGIPAYLINRRKDFETGKDLHITGSDLDIIVRTDIGREKKNRSYKGVRHSAGLTVRGQRTQTSGRKGASLGVMRKKDVKGSGK